MASANVIVLSSSPSHSFIATTPPPIGDYARASSTMSLPLPLPSGLMGQALHRPVLAVAGKPFTVLKGSEVGFRSVASLPGNTRLNDDFARNGVSRSEAAEEVQNKPKIHSAPRKKTTANKIKVTCLPCTGTEAKASPKTSKTKISRVKKSKDETQKTIKGAKVTKPGAPPRSKRIRPPVKDAKEKVVAAIDGLIEKSADTAAAPRNGPELNLDEAIKRRATWTPPRDTTDAAQDRAEQATEEIPFKSISGLLTDFGYTSITAPFRARPSETLIKRRKIELIENAVAQTSIPAAATAERSKSSRKKLQTITNKATAMYQIDETLDSLNLEKYFTPNRELEAGLEKQTLDPGKAAKMSGVAQSIPAMSVERNSTKASKKPKKKTAKVSVLLPPEPALKSASNQDLLFGTSSQLAGDESPRFVKDLQQALEASGDLPKELPLVGIESVPSTGKTITTRPGGLAALKASRNLWSIASRDQEGSLLHADHSGFMNISTLDSAEKEVSQKRSREGRSPSVCRNDLEDSSRPHPCETHPTVQEDSDPASVSAMPRSVAEASLRQRSRTKSPVKRNTISQSEKESSMPDFRKYNVSKLAMEINKFGFKPIKGKGNMIALLERCWNNRERTALQNLPLNTNIAQLEMVSMVSMADESLKTLSPIKKRGRPAKPKRIDGALGILVEREVPPKPRGRSHKEDLSTITQGISPRNTSSAVISTSEPRTPSKDKKKKKTMKNDQLFASIDEIEDSDSCPTPSPPRRRSAHNSPIALHLTDGNTETLTPVAAQRHLFKKITEAIKTFPPTHDPKNLTWHEKILLYDPIVLEDLTVWLNTQGLGRVGVDEEVRPTLVREWCEEKSICCLWKENLRGGTRTRY